MSDSNGTTSTTEHEDLDTRTAEERELDMTIEYAKGEGHRITFGPSWTPAMIDRFRSAVPGIVDEVLGRTHPEWCDGDHCTAYLESEGADGMHFSSLGPESEFVAYKEWQGRTIETKVGVTLEQSNQPGCDVWVSLDGPVLSVCEARRLHAYLGRLLEAAEGGAR